MTLQTDAEGIIEMEYAKAIEIRKGASIPELAEEFQVSETTLYKLANANKLHGCRRLGHRFIIHREAFEAWLSNGGQGA